MTVVAATFVEATTADGVTLHGAFHAGNSQASGLSVDAILLIHGTGANFYSSSLSQGLIPRLAEAGLPVLSVNTRGHDVIFNGRTTEGPRRMGSAYEIVDDCRHDLAAWLDWLVAQGFSRVAVVGHSLGAVKAIYAQALEPHAATQAVAALSPPRLSHSAFAARARGAVFLSEYESAVIEANAKNTGALMDVRFPLPQMITVASYLDKYGPEERYDVLKFIDRVTCPLLVTYGTAELSGMAFAGMPEALEERRPSMANLTLSIVAGADHVYTGAYTEVTSRLLRWLQVA